MSASLCCLSMGTEDGCIFRTDEGEEEEEEEEEEA